MFNLLIPFLLLTFVFLQDGLAQDEPSTPGQSDEESAIVEKPKKGIFGQITVTGEIPELPPLLAKGAQVKDSVCSENEIPDESLVVDSKGGLQNAFVYLRSVPPELKIPPAEGSALFTSKGCRFSPHSQVVQVGERLIFYNEDPVAENVKFRGFASAFSMTLPAKREGAGQIPKFVHLVQSSERIPARIIDDFHNWKFAWILALDHPFAAVSNANGQFKIQGLPPGKYEFVIWHERAGYLERRLAVSVTGDKPTKIELDYPIEAFLK